MAGYGVGTQEARYNTRLGKQSREQVNLCGTCGDEISGTELLCPECKKAPSAAEEPGHVG